MNVLGQIAKNIVVKDDLRAEVTEALLPVYANLDSINAKSERALDETKVLNERLTAIEQKTSSEVDRVVRLEAKLSNLKFGSPQSSGGIDKNDPNHCRISFKGFTTESLDSRFETVKQFVAKFQGKDTFVCIDTRMTGPYTARKPTNETFVQFCSRDARDRVFQALKDSEIKTAAGNLVKLSKSKPDFIRTRDWAMGKSEELIKAKLETAKIAATVKFEKGKETRKITVDGSDAFIQRFADARGNFVGSFIDLELP